MPSDTERITNEFMDRNGYGDAAQGANGGCTGDGDLRLRGDKSLFLKHNCVLEMTTAAYEHAPDLSAERASHLSAVS
jgi:hypothetical protein